MYYIIFYKKKIADENKELDKLDLKMGIVLGCRVCVLLLMKNSYNYKILGN